MALVQQAGAIVAKRTPEGPHILVVTALRNPAHWIFPKGHIERGESAAEAALRETHEEAGVEARLIAPAGSIEFDRAGERLHVDYFLLEFVRSAGSGEAGRRLLWLPYEQALERLSFADIRAVLEQIHPLIAQL